MTSAAFKNGLVLRLQSAPGMQVAPVRMENGTPVYRFRKELIRCGKFLTSDLQPFEVTPDTLNRWVAAFSNMVAAGVPVPVPSDHTKLDADNQRGHVVGMDVDGTSLFGTLELVGPDSPRLAASNDVSIFAEPKWTDALGNVYDWPIRHVALTPDPRIPGLKGFMPIAAANNKTKNVPILRLENGMPDILDPTIAGAIPADAPADPEAPKGSLKESVKSHFLDKAKAALEGDADPKDKLKVIGDLLKQMEQMLAKMPEDDPKEKPPVTASNAKPVAAPTMPKALISLSCKNRKLEIEQIFAAGRITAHQRKQLLDTFATDAAVTLTLSNEALPDAFEQTLAVLASNPRIVADEKTGQQLVLSNPHKPDADAEAKAAKEEHDRWRLKK